MWRGAVHLQDSTDLSSYCCSFLSPFLFSLYGQYQLDRCWSWPLLTFVGYDKDLMYRCLHFHQGVLFRKDDIPLDCKGKCIYCNHPYSFWDKEIHYQRCHFRSVWLALELRRVTIVDLVYRGNNLLSTSFPHVYCTYEETLFFYFKRSVLVLACTVAPSFTSHCQ